MIEYSQIPATITALMQYVSISNLSIDKIGMLYIMYARRHGVAFTDTPQSYILHNYNGHELLRYDKINRTQTIESPAKQLTKHINYN